MYEYTVISLIIISIYSTIPKTKPPENITQIVKFTSSEMLLMK